MKTHVGIFSADKNYLDEYFKALSTECKECQINVRTRIINTQSIVYSFHLVNCKEHVKRFYGMSFANVQLHYTLDPEFLPYILARLR